MSWFPFLYVVAALIVSIVWMGLAFGAVLTKMGVEPTRAWIPVLRWVAAAEAGRTSTTAVLIARSASALGVAILLVALALRGIQGDDISVAVGLMTLAGAVLYCLGAFVGWIFWIIGSGTIGMRLNIASSWTILAALAANIWSAIVGWANIGTPIPSDAIGKAASAGAAQRSLADAPPPTGLPAGASVFGEGLPALTSAPEAFDTTPFATQRLSSPTDASPAEATRPEPADIEPPQPDSAPVAPGWPAVYSQPAAEPVSEELPVAAPTGDVPVHSAPAAPYGVSSPALPIAPPPGMDSATQVPTAQPTHSQPAEPPMSAPPSAAPPLPDPLRPVSPYITAAIPQVPASIADSMGHGSVQRPEPEDDETVIEKIAEVPPAPPTPAAALAPGVDAQAASAAAAALASLPPGWAQTAADEPAPVAAAHISPPPAAPAPAAPQRPVPSPEPDIEETRIPSFGVVPDAPAAMEPPAIAEPPVLAEPPAVEEPAAAVPDSAPALDPTPPPTRPAPMGVWAQAPTAASESHSHVPPASALPVATEPAVTPLAAVPPVATAPSASASAAQQGDEHSDEGDDHTVVAQRRRDVWVLEVQGGDSYPLPEGEVSIGRVAAQPSDPSHVGIADSTRTMSKRHARLRLSDGVWSVSDLGSTNGTFVRGADGREVEVSPGSEATVEGLLLLGDLEARIVNQGGARS